MKKILIILSLLLMSGSDIFAQESTNTAKIKELKDKLASRVAELNLQTKKMIQGEIKTLSDQKIILTNNNIEINVNLDDDTTLTQQTGDGKKKTIKVDSMKSGQNIFTWGSFNSGTNVMTASNITVVDMPAIIIGRIKSIDSKNYQLIVTEGNKDILVDHNFSTKDLILNKDYNTAKGGFSKFAEKQLVYVFGYNTTDKNDKPMLSAQRIIILSSK